MSFNTERVKIGRQPVVVCELDLDFCQWVFGELHENYLLHSEDFSDAYWVGFATVTTNTDTAPDSTTTADTVSDVSAVGETGVAGAVQSFDATAEYTLSVYVKKDSATTHYPLVRLEYSGSTTEQYDCELNRDTGAYNALNDAVASDIAVEDAGDYWRVSITKQSADSANTVGSLYVAPAYSSTFGGGADGAATGGIVLWGAQAVIGGIPGEYTTTTSAAVTNGGCSASAASGSECYNTRKTCQDTARYSKTAKTYRFVQPVEGLPITVDMIPCISGKPSYAPMKITPGKGLGHRGQVQVKLRDFTYHDRGIDPYVATRSYTPEAQGTYWGKLLARNPYYRGRPMRIRTGYLGDSWDWGNFQTRLYIIDNISGPDKSGMVTITGKDPMTLLDDDRAQCPAPSTGVLAAGINSTATSFNLSPSGIGNSEYPTSGTLRIGSEEMTFSSRTADAVSGVTRAVNGTEADDHDADDVVQLAKVWSGVNVVDVIDDLLNNFVDGFDTSWIPYDQGISGPATGTDDEWDEEKGFYLSSNDITRTLSKPTGINKIISELTEQHLFNMFWHDTDQELKIHAIAPPKANAPVGAFDDDSNILADSVRLTLDEKARVSQVWVYYNRIDNTEGGKPEAYHNLYIAADLNQEDADLYGTKAVKIIYADWVPSQALAAQLAGRVLSRFYQVPKIIRFAVDAKDSDKSPSDLVSITTRFIQNEAGAREATRFEILQVDEKEAGHRAEIEALVSSFNGLYGFIGPDTLGDYSAESDANKQAYAFICPDSGVFADGSNGYKII